MRNYSTMPFADVRRDYLATSTTAMPAGGLIAWSILAVAAYAFGDALPYFAPFIAAAIPVPIAIAIDKFRGKLGLWREGNDNPIARLFMRFITVVGLLVPLVIIAARATGELDLLILGLAILSGVVWVPPGWGADDPAGFTHFVLRSVLCYAAYLIVPDDLRGAAIAGAAAVSYVYAIRAMRKPSSVQRPA
ncbi:hypothetical protein H5J25_10045 [Sphingomonas aliaeris]|uniref:Uncharacterized protein n=1 Tax=Sphingomonas aliaeris TaxID=2759526 RepID=A0A974S3D8_9SPHN|nr:hypothetical protein [Sphingomonas aliaeris]QQV75940.1 hypothetical protein H5J25_10045 [Sphingomonas aliaeris]